MLKFNGDSITFNDNSNQNTSAQNVVNEALENQVIAGNGISVSYDSDNDLLTINSTGSSGEGTIITNYGNNRLLTSDGTSTGINGESNLTFDGSLLSIDGNIVANSGSLDRLIFNTALGDPDLDIAQLAWNPTEGTVDLGISDTYAMHLGEELHYRVRNNTALTLLKGTPVYATGLTPGGNNRIEVAPFTADGSIREVRLMGLVTENISNGLNGYTTHFGYIRGIDTRGDAAANGTTNKLWASGEPAWIEGDILYVHPTTAGKLTKVEPKHSISVAIITNRHQNQGKIFVRSTSYGHLNDNHDVNVNGVTNGQFLQYDSATDYWVPSSSGNFSSLSINGNNLGLNSTMNGRLSFNNTSPVALGDAIGASTIYYYPYHGNTVSLYDTSSSSWKFYTLSSAISKSLSGLTTDTNYDVFLFLNSGVLDIEFLAWSNSEAGVSDRAIGVPRINGVYLKNTDHSRRYIGTFRTTGSGISEDSNSKRFLWNTYNRIPKSIATSESTSHTYNGGQRPWNNNTNYGETRAGLLVGLTEASVLDIHINTSTRYDGGAGPPQGESVVSVGLNSTSSYVCTCLLTSNQHSLRLRYGTSSTITVPFGFNYLQILESTNSQGNGFFNEANLRMSFSC